MRRRRNLFYNFLLLGFLWFRVDLGTTRALAAAKQNFGVLTFSDRNCWARVVQLGLTHIFLVGWDAKQLDSVKKGHRSDLSTEVEIYLVVPFQDATVLS
jgi:hypothetical protein